VINKREYRSFLFKSFTIVFYIEFSGVMETYYNFHNFNSTWIETQEDIDLMEALGVNSYRLSISWARILPSMLICIVQSQIN